MIHYEGTPVHPATIYMAQWAYTKTTKQGQSKRHERLHSNYTSKHKLVEMTHQLQQLHPALQTTIFGLP